MGCSEVQYKNNGGKESLLCKNLMNQSILILSNNLYRMRYISHHPWPTLLASIPLATAMLYIYSGMVAYMLNELFEPLLPNRKSPILFYRCLIGRIGSNTAAYPS